jgi:hypothetical protein
MNPETARKLVTRFDALRRIVNDRGPEGDWTFTPWGEGWQARHRLGCVVTLLAGPDASPNAADILGLQGVAVSNRRIEAFERSNAGAPGALEMLLAREARALANHRAAAERRNQKGNAE